MPLVFARAVTVVSGEEKAFGVEGGQAQAAVKQEDGLPCPVLEQMSWSGTGSDGAG